MLEGLILASMTFQSGDQTRTDGQHEIIVTGERVPRSIYETAASVAVIDDQAIADLAAPDRVEQLLQAIPNVQLGSGGEGPTIRGMDSTGAVRDLPAFLSGTRPRATITVDGRAASYYELAFGLTSIWDVERVEVFRSPQTTTQGRNAIGGAIFVETGKPAFDWRDDMRLIAGEAETRQFSATLSGPLVSDQLAFRLTGDLRHSRTSSLITNPAIGVDPNRDDADLVRLKLLFQPRQMPDASVQLSYAHGRSQMPQIEGVVKPFALRRDPTATYGIFIITTDSVTGRFAYSPANGIEARASATYGRADVHRRAPPGLGEAEIYAKDFSIEPIVSWRGRHGASLTAGFNFTHSALDQTINLATFPPVQGAGAFTDVQDSFGMFGEASLPLTTGLSATLGLRYQRDRQVRRGALTGRTINLPLDYDRSFRAWLPKIALDWDATPEVRLGVLAQRASNPGGVNLNTVRARVETFNMERLWDLELFARARLNDGRLTISANLFRYDIRDAQRSQLIALTLPGGAVITSAKIDNAPRAWSRGAEIGLDWRTSARLKLRGSVGLLDTRITATRLPSDPMLGKQFQRSPHLSASASAVWTPSQRLALSGQVRHNSRYFSDDLETPGQAVAGSTTVDVKASWTSQKVTIYGYVRNLFDEFHLTYLFDPAIGRATAGDPREAGIGIEARF